MSEDTPRKSLLTRLLDGLEIVGNRLPDPITLFASGAVLVLILSAVGASLGWQVDKLEAVPETIEVVATDHEYELCAIEPITATCASEPKAPTYELPSPFAVSVSLVLPTAAPHATSACAFV